jgi:streptogramin lyase
MNTKGTNKATTTLVRTAATLAAMAGLGLLATGCGLNAGDASAKAPITSASSKGVTGNVHGGQNPVTGATIQLYAVGTSGNGSAAAPLITATVTTSDGSGAVNSNANAGNGNNTYPAGNFSITGDYSCTGATQVYLVATGGNSGSGTNPNIALMAPLGDCATLQASAPYVQINELTTVGGAYALAQFATDYKHIGATGTNPSGLLNATANFSNLINVSSGTTGGANLPSGATVPTVELNTLADIIAACVNSSDAPTYTNCTTLHGATGATDTIGDALAIAKHPGSAAFTSTTLFNLVTAQSPFQTTLSAPPNDWTVAINYTGGGGLSAPYGIAIDTAGNAWISNSGASSVLELSSTGAVAQTLAGGGLIGPKGIAIDRSNNVWVAVPSANSVVEFSSTGTLQSGAAGYTAGGLNGPVALAMDSAGNAWVANLTGSSVTELSPAGAAIVTATTAGGTINLPTGIALGTAGNVYVANNGGGNVVKLTHAGAAATGSPYTDSALQGTTAVALDANNNLFATGSLTGNAVQGAVSQFSSTGAVATGSPYTGGGATSPIGVAVSGSNAWVTNYNGTTGSLSEFTLGSSTAVSPAAGLGLLNAPVGVAIDASGDVWTANSGSNTVSQFLGLATPAITPLAANVGP